MRPISGQRGAVLMVSLIILLVLTLIGISGARGVLMSERMTSASRDAKIALEVAESMTSLAEEEIEKLTQITQFGTVSWQHMQGEGPGDVFSDQIWENNSSISTAKKVPMLDADGKKMSGRMYIERFGLAANDDPADNVDQSAGKPQGKTPKTVVFKIVSHGVGTGGTERIIVTLYGKEF
ncbi:PilX N-terminal domain-containing pilus assembly protein [uncultured Microbulbifer sp.]|uniref:pilus assembly PilX family protein n=1 Tax=uncultured Microbulbifer sp. TaxID=348147 RepID=UPI00261B763F|nr:PilX N-terminal domain-containing pilus assembly protein [uncultured Microbulbifer sp.]